MLHFGIQAEAQGFVCRTNKESVAVSLVSFTDREARKVDVMILADQRQGFDRQNLARFSSDNGSLKGNGSRYSATVNFEALRLERKEYRIRGISLEQIKNIDLNLDFSSPRPVPEGDELEAELLLTTLKGDVISLAAECLHYLRQDD